jgi:hypothetical protein
MVGSKLNNKRRRVQLTSVAVLGTVFIPAVFAAQPTVFKQPVQPFFSFNQSPIIQAHGLPAIDNARVLDEGKSRYRLVHDLASNYTFNTSPNEDLLFDGETHRSTFAYSRGIGSSWEWGVQIPFIRHGGGLLDRFIEDWHGTFSLPQGGRDFAPHNRLTYRYQRNGINELLLTESSSGMGDVRLTLGKQWPSAGKNTRLALRGLLSLPTGDTDKLQGSGSTDAAVWATANRPGLCFAVCGNLFGGGGLLLMGEGDVLADQQRRMAVFGSVGAGVRVLPWMSLKLQADIHSPLYDQSALEQINATSVQLLMGGDLQLGKNISLDLMVSEDITVHASPDVVFHLGLTVD